MSWKYKFGKHRIKCLYTTDSSTELSMNLPYDFSIALSTFRSIAFNLSGKFSKWTTKLCFRRASCRLFIESQVWGQCQTFNNEIVLIMTQPVRATTNDDWLQSLQIHSLLTVYLKGDQRDLLCLRMLHKLTSAQHFYIAQGLSQALF